MPTIALFVSIVAWGFQSDQELVQKYYAEAVEAFRSDRLRDAEFKLRQLLQISLNIPEAHNLLGVILDRTNRDSEAEESFLKAIQLLPAYKEAFQNLGIHWTRRSDFEKALGAFQKLLALDPDSTVARFRMAWIYKEQGKFEQAAVLLKDLSRSPTFQSKELYRLLGEIYLSLKQGEPARTFLGNALEIDQKDPTLWALLGNALEMTGQVQDAVAAYRTALQLNPASNHTRLALATLLYRAEDYQESLDVLNQWDPSQRTSQYFTLLGSVHAKMDHLVKAGTSFESALALDSSNFEAHYNLALLLIRGNSFSQAEKVLNQALDYFPDSQELLTALGFAQQLDLRFAQAQETFRRITGLWPNESNGYFYLGNSLMETGDFEGALSAFEKAQELAPNDHRIYYLRGLIRAIRGEDEEALELFGSCISLRPEFVFAYFQRAKILFRRGKLVESLDATETAIALDPDYPQARFQKGQILARMGKAQEAQQEFTEYGTLKEKLGDKEFRAFVP